MNCELHVSLIFTLIYFTYLSRLYAPTVCTLFHSVHSIQCVLFFVLQAEHIERETRLQAKAKLWFSMREGRITASMFKDSVRTNPDSPAKKLICQICYPQTKKFATEATRYASVLKHGKQNVKVV